MSEHHGTELHFDRSYTEESTLGDGTMVVLRMLRPTDAGLLQRGFESLSPQSRQSRFFRDKRSLSDEELHNLTEIDGWNHFAIGAVRKQPDGDEGLGVARFLRLTECSDVAEAAVTVVDAAQGKGLGTMLLQRLSAAARERGIEWFHCDFLAHNRAVYNLLRDHAPGVRFENDGDVVRAEIPVPSAGATEHPNSFDRAHTSYRLLRESARGAIQVQLGRLVLKWERLRR